MKCQCVCLLLQVTFFVVNCLAENLILNINLKNPIAVTDHAFLSFTLDPATLQHNDFIKNLERSTNLARGLAPAYIRLGGPQSNFYNLEKTYSHEIDMDPNDMYFGTQWKFIYQWATNAGLDIIVSISPDYIDNESKTDSKDPRNIAELLSFSDRMGYNISWQLGYECQTRCDLSGGQLGRYVANLQEILKTFPRYSSSLIIGPDIVAYRTAQQQRYLEDYLHSANAALSAITWHPVSLNNDKSFLHYDNMITGKDEIYKIISRAAEEKPLWIAQSKPEDSKRQYLGALIWTKRLGEAAKLGIQVVMRQLSNLSQATPVYWVSLLHKTLVGREVLEMKLQSENKGHVHFYSQCTKSSVLYSKGAITIFGINLTSRKVIVSLKGLKIKILHEYILSSDFENGNKMFSEQVLLNNKSLHLINDKELPDINPEIIINPDGLELELSSGDIGFWVIPNAKVKACICSDEETNEDNRVKKLSKRHDIRQADQEEIEEDMNQSNVKENDIKENINQSNLTNQKIYGKRDRKSQGNVENTVTKSQQKAWGSKLLATVTRFIQKYLQKKNNFTNLQRSFTIDLGDEQGNSSKEVEEQQNLDEKDLKNTEVDDNKSIQDILKKYRRILLEKKLEMETKGIQESEIKNIDNTVALISKINASLFDKVTSNEIKGKTKNEEESIIKIDKKLREYLIELENSDETKSHIIKRIGTYFNKLYNLLENNNSAKNNKDSQVSIREDLTKGKRFRRCLDKKSKNSKKRTFQNRSQIDNLKNHLVKQKIKQKNNDGKDLISCNVKKNFNNNEKKSNNLFQRDHVESFFKNNAAHHIEHQHSSQEHKKIENDNIYRKDSKIGDMEKYQSLIQEPKRTKRNINENLIEMRLRRDNASGKRSRIDDLNNHINERKTKQNDDIKREELLIPFNPRITESDEDFYGFSQRDPVKGFPEGDIFMTAGDSLEQNGKDYDYVEVEDVGNDKKKSTQQNKTSMLERTEDNIWVEEIKDDHYNDMPNEFFEHMKLFNIKAKEISEKYDDLWEAEFSFEKHNDNKNNNNNKIPAAKVIQEQSPNQERKKRARESSMQHNRLVNYYDDSKEQEYGRNALRLASRYPSISFDQLSKTPISNNNYQTANVELRESKLKMEPEKKISNSFYLPFQVSTARYDYNNYQTSNMMNHDEVELKDEKSFVMNTVTDDVNAKITQYSKPTSVEPSIRDKIFHNKRNKRSNWEKLQKVFAEEMIKEGEENASDCHCRVIRTSDLPKKLYRRVKRNILVPTARVTDTSIESDRVSTDVAQSKENVPILTGDKYEEIIAGEILPSTSIIEPISEENDITVEPIITSTLDHKLNDMSQAIDATTISGEDTVSEQYQNAKESTTNLLPIDSTSEISLNNDNGDEYITKEMFFRAQPSDVQAKNKTETFNSSEIISKIPSQNKSNCETFIISVTKAPQETPYEKEQDLINEKERAESSNYPTIEDQKNKEGHNSNCKIGLNSINFPKETSKEIKQETTETILSKQATNTGTDKSKLNKSETNPKLFQNIEDNQDSKSNARMRKDAFMSRLTVMLKNLPRTSIERFTRYEGHLTRRAEQIGKQKEKLQARREKLLHQYQNELSKISDEQKRSMKRREAWEKLRESDNFHRLINQGASIGILLNDDITYKDDDENDLIPIELAPKQYKNIIDQIYLLAKAKKVHYSEHNKYSQFIRDLIENDKELIETSQENLNNKMSNDNKVDKHVEQIINGDLKARELGKENIRIRRDIEEPTDEYTELTEDARNRIRTYRKEAFRKIFHDQPIAIFPLRKEDSPLSADLFQKLKNHLLVSSTRNFKINQDNEKGRESDYVALVPIKIKNIYEMLDAVNDDSLESFDISAQRDDQNILGKKSDSINKFLDDVASEECEYDDLSNQQSENISDEESLYENEQTVSMEDNEAESETDEQYEITSDEIDKYLKLKHQTGSNKRKIFLLFPWRNIKKRQHRQIQNKINEGIIEGKREVTGHSQSNKSILAEVLGNKRTKRYLNNNIDEEGLENIIETNDIKTNYLQPQTNKQNRDDLLEDFIKAHNKNNLHNEEVPSSRTEEKDKIILLNNISKSNKNLLQETTSKLQTDMKSVEESIDSFEKNFNKNFTLAPDEDKHKNRTSEITDNAFYTAIMNINDFFAFFSKLSCIFRNFV